MKHARALFLSALVGLSLAPSLVTVPAHAGLSRVPTSVSQTVSVSGPEFESQVMIEINAARERAGLARVRFFDSCIDGLATAWGARIAETNIFAHRDQHEVLRRCNQSWAGENLIRGADLTPRIIVRAWLASPAHRAVMLKPRATRAGLAVVLDDNGRQVGVLNVADVR